MHLKQILRGCIIISQSCLLEKLSFVLVCSRVFSCVLVSDVDVLPEILITSYCLVREAMTHLSRRQRPG